uniref:Uncharacterized protein n=1 Tax=Anopheles triannulatus TaxID=58253 RepID=A0A2M4AUJ9_9DIPT
MFRIVVDGRIASAAPRCCYLTHARVSVTRASGQATLTNPLPGGLLLWYSMLCLFPMCPGLCVSVYLCPSLKLLITSSCNLYFSIISMKITTSRSCVSWRCYR